MHLIARYHIFVKACQGFFEKIFEYVYFIYVLFLVKPGILFNVLCMYNLHNFKGIEKGFFERMV